MHQPLPLVHELLESHNSVTFFSVSSPLNMTLSSFKKVRKKKKKKETGEERERKGNMLLKVNVVKEALISATHTQFTSTVIHLPSIKQAQQSPPPSALTSPGPCRPPAAPIQPACLLPRQPSHKSQRATFERKSDLLFC